MAAIDRRRAKARKYSYDAIKILQYACLQYAWAVAGGICGKYLAQAMPDPLEAHRHLVPDQRRYSTSTRGELLAMSPATIDRYYGPARAKDTLRGKSAAKLGTLLRNSIQIRKGGDEVEAEPGFFEVDSVAHCGPTLKAQLIRSVSHTNMHTGGSSDQEQRRRAHRDRTHPVRGAVPYLVTGPDFDNGSEFINHNLFDWAAEVLLPLRHEDRTRAERTVVIGNDRLNYFTPTKKPTGYSTDAVGRRKRIYDTARTPFAGLLDSLILNSEQVGELAAGRAMCMERELEAKRALPDSSGIRVRPCQAG